MYDSDYEQYREELKRNYESEFGGGSDDYAIRVTGEEAVHSDGVRRDKQGGKTLYTLLFPKGVPMPEQLFVRVAKHYTAGGEKHGNRNWENSCAPDTLEHHTEALWRHFMEFFFDTGKGGEDHAAAVVWNVNAVDLTRRNIRKAAADEHTRLCEEIDEQLALPPEISEIPGPGLSYLNLIWENGDRLTEVDPSPGMSVKDAHASWIYSAAGDVWYFEDSVQEPEGGVNRSARSLKNLIRQFGPVNATRGKHAGWTLHKDGTITYGAE